MKRFMSALLLCASTLMSAHAGAEDWSTLRYGVDPSHPPFSSRDASGKLIGFDIDLGTEICKRINAKCEWVQNDFDGMIPALQAKKFDAILASMSITDKRKQVIAFTSRLYKTPNKLIVRKDTTLEPTPESLKGKSIGFQQGTVPESYAKEHWAPAGARVVSYPNFDQVFADVSAGRLDGCFTDAAVGEYGFLRTPQGADFKFSGGNVYASNGAGIGLRKSDVELKDKIDKAIADMLADGTYKRLAGKYFQFDPYGS
ncbi:ABC transporter substrate-binding protein [Burkholderia sp. SRS-W-2-2016]|uniref:ABC transporter substrate-binding protein n=1 Tax=Burkholderia sp. SRS-W-2-2016 TaxID=1926878 RepID=UPI00094AE000|nr:ABC transporter substrate-binding protein [Burkholderia sp. SRS-W-2-2016]OLL28496.1 ABC transporter substrate-binding protein [Burkholderia sp. SRS-W-2-2016]